MEQRKETVLMKDDRDLAGVSGLNEGGNNREAVNSLSGWFENRHGLFFSFLSGLIAYFNSRELVNPNSAIYWSTVPKKSICWDRM